MTLCMRHTAHILFTYFTFSFYYHLWRPLSAPKLRAATRALSKCVAPWRGRRQLVVVDANSAGAMSSQAWLDEEADEEVDEEVDVCWAKNTE